jgi:hypothetical protein
MQFGLAKLLWSRIFNFILTKVKIFSIIIIEAESASRKNIILIGEF